MNHRANLNERDDATSSNVVPFRPASPGEPQSLGDAVAAVIMSLQTDYPRIWVQVVPREEDQDHLL